MVQQQRRRRSVGTPGDGAKEGGRGGAARCEAWEPLCVYHRETVPTQNNEHALPLLNKKGISAFFSPLKVMELEIGSPHKSLQSVDSLVWPRTVPRLRSLSTEQSQAKHIFIDCACVRSLEREAGMCACTSLGRQSMYSTRVVSCIRTKQRRYAGRTAYRGCQTGDVAPFFHHKLAWDKWHFAEPKSSPRHQTDLCVVMMSEESWCQQIADGAVCSGY